MPVVVPWSPPEAFDGVSVNDLRTVQDRIAAAEWRSSDQTSEWVGYAVADVLKLDPSKTADKRRIKSMLATWIKNGALRVESRPDANRKGRPYVVVGELAERDA